jgi:outer membrane receptor protein involved in Fe transport
MTNVSGAVVYAVAGVIWLSAPFSFAAEQIEEVLVTARKVEESAQDVPVAIQAFDAKQIEKYASTTLNEIVEMSNQVLAFGQASGNGGVFFIRGQGTGSLDPGLESSVTVNIDGVQVDRGHIHRQAFFDLNNVQILKGPQALFFGKNSPAGVIALQSAMPGEEFEAKVHVGYEFEADEKTIEAVVSGPVTDTLGIRLAYQGSDYDGYLDNDAKFISTPIDQAGLTMFPDEPFDFPGAAHDKAGAQTSHAARLTVDWRPSDDFSATWKLLGTTFETDNFATIENISCSGAKPITFALGGTAAFFEVVGGMRASPSVGGQDPNGDCKLNGKVSLGSLPREIAASYPHAKNGDPYGTYDSVLSSLELEWDLGDYVVNSTTGYYWYDYTRWDNFDGTGLIQFMGVQLEHQQTYSEEIRLRSEFEGPVNFTLGAFYETFERDSNNSGKIFSWGFDPVTGRSNTWSGQSTIQSDSYSAFGQIVWDINERLEFTGGARFTKDDRNAKQGNTYVHSTDGFYQAIGIWCGTPGTPCAAPFFSPAGVKIKSDFDDNDLSPELTLTWRPTDNLTLWTAYREGYKAGGFSTNTVLVFGKTGKDLTFDAELAEAYEVGIKSLLMDGKVRFNANAYHYEFTDQQVSAFDNKTTSFTINNAASSTSEGVEVDTEYLVTENLNLRAQWGYNNAEYDKYPNAACYAGQTPAQGCVGGLQNLKGSTLGFAPHFSGSLGFDYERPINGQLRAGMSYDAIYSDRYVAGGYPTSEQKDFWRHNVRVGLFDAEGTWDVTLIGRNLANQRYIAGCADKPGGAAGDVFCQTVRARQVLLEATYRM